MDFIVFLGVIGFLALVGCIWAGTILYKKTHPRQSN